MRFSSLNTFYISSFLKAQILLLPILYLFYLDNGLKLSDYFFIQGLIVIINVLLQIPVGLISNYISRKYLIITSYVIYLLRIILWLSGSGYLIVLIGEIFYAVSKSIFDAVEAPYIYEVLQDNNNENKMLKNYSYLNFAVCLGCGMASLLGAYLYNYFNEYKILLLVELIIMSFAILFAFYIPKASVGNKYKYSFEKIKKAGAFILKSQKYFIPILYSAILVAFSHFFFWSFQPLMKAAFIPIPLFGGVILVNNILRALGSINTSLISEKISFFAHGIMVFIINIAAFTLFCFADNALNNKYFCMIFILFLCLSIALQLSFSIRQGTYLQDEIPNRLRGYIAGVNMFFARMCIGIVLILPKYIHHNFSLNQIYNIYFVLFVVLNLLLIPKFAKLFKRV